MVVLSKNAEELLEEILVNRDDKGNCETDYWKARFETLSEAEDNLLRGGFKELLDNNMISVDWGDDCPDILLVLGNGMSYFKEKQNGLSFIHGKQIEQEEIERDDRLELHDLIAQIEDVKNNPGYISVGRKSSLFLNNGENPNITATRFSNTQTFIAWAEDLKLFLSTCTIKESSQVKEVINLVNSFKGYGEKTKIEQLQAKLIALEKNYTRIEIMEKKDMLPNNGKRVFVVHGHDEGKLLQVKDFIRDLQLEPIILKEQASSGMTIIEKIEAYTDVVYGVVLYTACDLGMAKEEKELKKRARQNVVFEHGYLINKLGRKRVAALVEEGVETPGDLSGVVYISLDTENGWKISLIKEMKAAGLDVFV